MAVQSDTSRISYAGNNSTTTSYAVPFVFLENAHLKAIAKTSAGVESVVTLTNHTGAGSVNGGTVRTSVAIPATSTLTIYRDVPITQTTTYAEGGDFPAASHERALDKLTQITQQLDRELGQTIRMTEAMPLNPLPVPTGSQQYVLSTTSGQAPSWQPTPSLATGPITATGSTEPRFLADRFADAVNVKDFGAVGDGVADDTAAFAAAIAAGSEIYVSDGTYMLDYITINKKVAIRLSNSATLKQRIPTNPTTTLNAHWGIFRFVAGSNGSLVEGGTLDGNRAVLAPYYVGHTRLGQDNHWWGIRTEFVNDFICRNTRFVNFMSEGFYHFNGDRVRFLDVVIEDCGVAFAMQGRNEYSRGCKVRAVCRNIGNVIDGTAYYLFQHGITFGIMSEFMFDVTFDGFCASGLGVDGQNTGGGKEPVPIGMNLYLLEGGSINAAIRHYTTVSAEQSIHQAFNFSSVNNCQGRMSAFGFEQALVMATSSGNSLDVDFDGDFLTVSNFPRAGLLLTHGGVATPNAATLAGEAGSALSSRDNAIRGTIRRFGMGVRDEGEGNDLGGLSVFGNVSDGVQLVRGTGTSGSYPVSRDRPSGGRDVVGINVTTNGNAGVIYTGGTGDRIVSGYIRDNGQTIGSTAQPWNIAIIAESGQGVDLQIVGNDCDATTGVTIANEYSFVPSAATPKPSLRVYNSDTALTHVYDFVVRNANNYRIGEIVRFNGCLAGPANATGKIVDIQQDTLTAAFASALSFVDTNVLDTLTGTGSTNGINVIGVGTNFVNEVDFPMYLKNGAEYRRLVYVNSATSAVINAPFTTPLSLGSSLQVVLGDVTTGVVLPTTAIHINNAVTVGPLLIKDNIHHNLNNAINPSSFVGIDGGSRWHQTYFLTMAGSALSNTLVSGLPNHTQVTSVSVTNSTAITGVLGTVNVDIMNASAGPLLKSAITGAVLTSGAVNRGATPDCAAFGAFGGRVLYVSSSGNPTGTVSAKVTLSKLEQG